MLPTVDVISVWSMTVGTNWQEVSRFSFSLTMHHSLNRFTSCL